MPKRNEYSAVQCGDNESRDANYQRPVDDYEVHSRTWNQFAICFTASSVTFLVGLFIGWLGPTIAKLSDTNSPIHFGEYDPQIEVALITVMPPLGTICGPIVLTYFLNTIGRKRTVLLTIAPFIIGNFVIFRATGIQDYMIGIFCMGFNMYSMTILSIYITEVASPRLRDSFGCFIMLQLSIGSFTGYIISTNLSEFVGGLLYMAIPLVITLLIIVIVPESPYFYLHQNRGDAARDTLRHLYRDEFVDKELRRLTKAIEQEKTEKKGSVKELFTVPGNVKPLVLLICLFFFHFFSGMTVIVSFFPKLLRQVNTNILTPETAGLIIAGNCIGMNVLAAVLLKKIEKKKLLLFSTTCTAIAMGVLASFYFYYNVMLTDVDRLRFASNVPFFALLMFSVSTNFGLNQMPYIYFREIVPLSYVAMFTLIVDILNPVFQLLSITTYNLMSYRFGNHVGFAVFFTCLVAGLLVFTLFLPNTKNRTLERIQEEMKA